MGRARQKVGVPVASTQTDTSNPNTATQASTSLPRCCRCTQQYIVDRIWIPTTRPSVDLSIPPRRRSLAAPGFGSAVASSRTRTTPAGAHLHVLLSSHRETRKERRVKQSRRTAAQRIPADFLQCRQCFIGSLPRRGLAGGGNQQRERERERESRTHTGACQRQTRVACFWSRYLSLASFFSSVDGNAEVLDQQL
jgi:hypothetical protein